MKKFINVVIPAQADEVSFRVNPFLSVIPS